MLNWTSIWCGDVGDDLWKARVCGLRGWSCSSLGWAERLTRGKSQLFWKTCSTILVSHNILSRSLMFFKCDYMNYIGEIHLYLPWLCFLPVYSKFQDLAPMTNYIVLYTNLNLVPISWIIILPSFCRSVLIFTSITLNNGRIVSDLVYFCSITTFTRTALSDTVRLASSLEENQSSLRTLVSFAWEPSESTMLARFLLTVEWRCIEMWFRHYACWGRLMTWSQGGPYLPALPSLCEPTYGKKEPRNSVRSQSFEWGQY